MDTFPTGLLFAIALYLNDKDIINLRLVNKRLEDVVFPLFIRKFKFFDNRRSISRMKHLLKDDKLKQLVKVLKYDTKTAQENAQYQEVDPKSMAKRRQRLNEERQKACDPDDEILGSDAFREVVEGFVRAGSPPDKIRALSLSYNFFDPEKIPADFGQTCVCLTSIKLSITVFDADNPLKEASRFYGGMHRYREVLETRTLQRFLAQLSKLTSISLEFQDRGVLLYGQPVARLVDVVPLDRPWPLLRKLCLANFDTRIADFLRLMRNHSSNLKVLQLKSFRLYGDGANRLPQMFEELANTLTLESATICGLLSDSISANMSNLYDMEILGPALANYLINGGECPINTM